MRTEIRPASGDDAQRVAAFFTMLYETRHGIGSASSLEMLQRTVASLFAGDDTLSVFLSEDSSGIQGVVAARQAEGDTTCELTAIQADDTIRGRGVAQTLLGFLVGHCASRGGAAIVTSVAASDVRARGFLRREGFVAAAEEIAIGSPASEELIVYTLDVETARARVTLTDEDQNT